MSVQGPWVAEILTQYLSGKSVKALALTSAHSVDMSTEFRDEIGGELADGGYPAGGVAVGGLSVDWDDVEQTVLVSCDLVNFGSVTADDVSGVVFYVNSGDPATDRVMWTDLFDPIEADGTLTYEAIDGAMAAVIT